VCVCPSFSLLLKDKSTHIYMYTHIRIHTYRAYPSSDRASKSLGAACHPFHS
jgi:hypothetical protein